MAILLTKATLRGKLKRKMKSKNYKSLLWILYFSIGTVCAQSPVSKDSFKLDIKFIDTITLKGNFVVYDFKDNEHEQLSFFIKDSNVTKKELYKLKKRSFCSEGVYFFLDPSYYSFISGDTNFQYRLFEFDNNHKKIKYMKSGKIYKNIDRHFRLYSDIIEFCYLYLKIDIKTLRYICDDPLVGMPQSGKINVVMPNYFYWKKKSR
jgi:hypothetical protein